MSRHCLCFSTLLGLAAFQAKAALDFEPFNPDGMFTKQISDYAAVVLSARIPALQIGRGMGRRCWIFRQIGA